MISNSMFNDNDALINQFLEAIGGNNERLSYDALERLLNSPDIMEAFESLDVRNKLIQDDTTSEMISIFEGAFNTTCVEDIEFLIFDTQTNEQGQFYRLMYKDMGFIVVKSDDIDRRLISLHRVKVTSLKQLSNLFNGRNIPFDYKGAQDKLIRHRLSELGYIVGEQIGE